MTAITERTAIVTGAGTGIGKSVATTLLKAGWNTVFCGRRKKVLEEAIAEAGQTKARALAVACDISKAVEVDDMFETVVEAFGRVDLLFNNAGMSYKSTPIDEIPVEVWNDVVGVNLTGLTRTLALDGRPYDIACGQIDIGNALTEMAQPMTVGVPQANGSIAAEAVMDVQRVADAVLHMASLPLDANVLFMTVMATKMPFVGRG